MGKKNVREKRHFWIAFPRNSITRNKSRYLKSEMKTAKTCRLFSFQRWRSYEMQSHLWKINTFTTSSLRSEVLTSCLCMEYGTHRVMLFKSKGSRFPASRGWWDLKICCQLLKGDEKWVGNSKKQEKEGKQDNHAGENWNRGMVGHVAVKLKFNMFSFCVKLNNQYRPCVYF